MQETFEAPVYASETGLQAYAPWTVTAGSAVISDEAAHAGSQSVKLDLNSPATIVNRAVPSPASGVYFTDLWIKPVAEPGGLAHLSVDGAEVGFLRIDHTPTFGTHRGAVIAADGAGSRVLAADQVLTTGSQFASWVRLSLRHSVGSGTFDVFVDGVLRAVDLTADTTGAPVGTLKLYGAVATPVFLDDFRFSSAHPLFPDADGDGLPDSWESIKGLIANGAHGRYDDPDGDGLSNILEYLALSNPLAVDTDADGMGDAYEAANGLRANDASDLLEDRDGDQVPNLWEFKKGTEAGSAASVPAADFVVDPALGGASGSDAIYATITEAVNAAPTISAQPNAYPLIRIVGGTYIEALTVPNTKRMALVGVAGRRCPVVQPSSMSLNFYSPLLVLNGLEFTQAAVATSSQVLNFSPPSGAMVHLSNCLVRGRHAVGYGIYNAVGNLTLSHCTIFGFKSSQSGVGVLQSYNNGWTTLRDCIVWNAESPSTNQVYATNATKVTVASSIIKGGAFGGLNVNPQLNGLGELVAGSPAINGGGSFLREGADLHGEARTMAPDLGADEFVDTDGDALQDGLEQMSFGGLAESGTADTDGDGLSNVQEQDLGTSLNAADTDADGLSDSGEVAAGASPFVGDTDADGMGDAYEAANGLRANDASDLLEDRDGDQVPNLWEFKKGTEAGSAASVPAADFVVDPALGGVSGSDAIYATITEAVNAAPTTLAQPNAYPLIQVKAGTYTEAPDLAANKRLALIGATGATRSRINQPQNDRLSIYGPLVVITGFEIVQHASTSSELISISGPSGNSTIRISNCLIRGQSAVGRALYNYNSHLTLAHCTLTGFRDANTGVSVQQSVSNSVPNGSCSLRNSILWNPLAGGAEITTTGVTISSSIVRGGLNGGLNSNPLLDAAFRLSFGSPAIDAGLEPPFHRVDLAGSVRFDAPDLGAYESGDEDVDGLRDTTEIDAFATLAFGALDDPDGDGLSNLAEQALHTGMNTADSDDDGMADGWEHMFGLNPLSATDAAADPDGDGLVNAGEFAAGSNPLAIDSDSDAMPDGWEVAAGLDPSLAADAGGDADGDGMANVVEFLTGCHPLDPDTDADTLPDGWEFLHGLDPLDPADAPQDFDGDGLTNLAEHGVGTDPADADSDADGMPDGWEIIHGFNPTSAGDALLDADADGLSNHTEFERETDPRDADSDDDSISDGSEAGAGLNPLDADTDDDGLPDGVEITGGTDPLRMDSDGDGVSDSFETAAGSNPLGPTAGPVPDPSTGLLLLTPSSQAF